MALGARGGADDLAAADIDAHDGTCPGEGGLAVLASAEGCLTCSVPVLDGGGVASTVCAGAFTRADLTSALLGELMGLQAIGLPGPAGLLLQLEMLSALKGRGFHALMQRMALPASPVLANLHR